VKNDDHKRSSQKEVELLIVEAFRRASQAVDAFQRLTIEAWRFSAERDAAHETADAPKTAPEVEERDGILICTIKEACKKDRSRSVAHL